MRVIIVIMSLTWATSCKTIDPYVASGELEHNITREVIETGTLMFRACNDHVLTAAQCDGWVKFVEKYKKGRALAIKTWRFAVANDDAIQKGKAVDIILALSAELSEFTSLVIQLTSTTGGPL